jgi:adenylate cyclase
MGPQEKVERRLAAIFAADVAGYSRLMSQDEVGTLRNLTAHREIMDRLTEGNVRQGLVMFYRDSLLAN